MSETDTDPVTGIDFGLFLARLLTACSFFAYQLLDNLRACWNYVWSRTEWDLLPQLEGLQIPYPATFASGLLLLLSIGFLGLVLGVFARASAAITMGLLGFVLLALLDLSPTLTPQAIVAYLIVMLVLIAGGPGKFSLDWYFTTRGQIPEH